MANAQVVRRVGVIGGGIAGAIAARRLRDEGFMVTVLDKGRGPGGRCSTRRADDLYFDHGAQYFTARGEAFAKQVDAWRSAGVAAV